ncbi:MAG: TonB-dependent receptor plug domain-containing protein [Taibaiella sp.]|nr:TonB-dependent receptor plug domain-containing protein [Taibaiella sp.]
MMSTTPATAQRQQVQSIDSVIVVSDRIDIPFSRQNRNIQILTAADIQSIPHKSINELLSYVAGVDVRQKGPNGTQADIGIDGGTFDQTLILIDGIKMSDPQTGHNMMNLPVTTDAIERIEILKGPAARIYGVNAMMGVINIVTRKGHQNETYAKIYAGSSFDKDDSTNQQYHNYGIQAYQTIHSGSWNHLITAGLDRGNGYRYNTAYRQLKAMYAGQGQLAEKNRDTGPRGYR